jgi:hypothetical protein
MGAPDAIDEPPIIMKYAYIKILFLTHEKKFRNRPILRKSLRGSSELQDIYDVALYYVNTRFNTRRPRHFKWQHTSEQGTIDDVFQLYPFKYDIVSPDPATQNDPRKKENPVDTKLTDNVIVVAHHYNSFQEGREWAGARADDDTEGIRVVVDFSSVTTLSGKGEALFSTHPWGEMQKGISGVKVPVSVELVSSRIFTAACNNASKDDVLRIWWKINWDNLSLWQAFSEVQPSSAEGGDRHIPTIPTDRLRISRI